MKKDIELIIENCDSLLKIILSNCQDIKSQILLLKQKNILFEKISCIEENINKILDKENEK